MKTRTEMIYDFMLALASNPNMLPDPLEYQCSSEEESEIFNNFYSIAAKLSDKYLENL